MAGPDNLNHKEVSTNELLFFNFSLGIHQVFMTSQWKKCDAW